MSLAKALAERLVADIARHSAMLGHCVVLNPDQVLDRSDAVALTPPGQWSANGSCRLAQAADGWIAVNLARIEDRDLLPAWLEDDGDPWLAVRRQRHTPLAARARLLGLPCAIVGEAGAAPPLLRPMGRPGDGGRRSLRVVDLSSLWAGPLCAGIFASLGADVCKVESLTRPDPSAAGLNARLNGDKRLCLLDFACAADRVRLAELVMTADVLVTSARRRAFEGLGLAPELVFATRPALTWVAISGYGWGDGADRVAFGDDAAAAGGLVCWTADGAPRFLGDALADPLTGLAAAAAALEAVSRGGGVLVDASMTGVAAWAAAGR